jgi:Tfp pilus assembly protein PilO
LNAYNDQIESIKQVWQHIILKFTSRDEFPNPNLVHEVQKRSIVTYLCEEHISPDIEKGEQLIDNLVGENLMTEGFINFKEFNKLF